MSDQIIAWVDESGSNATFDPDTYIMAAALTAEGQLADARNAMRGLLLRGQRKVHWRDEGAARQRRIAETIASLELEHLVVVTSPHSPGGAPEGRRRLTLKALLPELAALGVDQVVFESRGAADDKRDRAMVGYLRQQRLLDATLRIDHRVGRLEPALWIPDALCGITTAYRSGDGALLQHVAHKVTMMELPPRR